MVPCDKAREGHNQSSGFFNAQNHYRVLRSKVAFLDLLVKFRKEPVALAGEVSQMYHQILLYLASPN